MAYKIIKGIIKNAYVKGEGIHGILYTLGSGLCSTDSDRGHEITTSPFIVVQPLNENDENGPTIVETLNSIYVVANWLHQD